MARRGGYDPPTSDPRGLVTRRPHRLGGTAGAAKPWTSSGEP